MVLKIFGYGINATCGYSENFTNLYCVTEAPFEYTSSQKPIKAEGNWKATLNSKNIEFLLALQTIYGNR